ncbi:hypothetical protein A9Q89_09170 [Gammaproteobacteria bacterium 53_120_T64]|nr:hypothetical protein A9Q89_09170 [Gammaproteobacteria bacterium 53_120_T64]
MHFAAFAAQNLMLSARAMGYDSCPMIGFDADAVGQLIKLPADHLIVMLLAIGKAAAQPQARGGQLARHEVLLSNRFPDPIHKTTMRPQDHKETTKDTHLNNRPEQSTSF